MKLDDQYMSFPTANGHIKLPLSSRSGALAGVALLPACRPGAVWLQRAAWSGVRAFGARVLPWAPEPWRPPPADEIWNELTQHWEEKVGRFDAVVVSERRQQVRNGFSVLLVNEGAASLLIRLRRDPEHTFLGERDALAAVKSYLPRTFTAPVTVDSGTAGDWSWIASTVFTGIHTVPSNAPLSAVTSEISEALAVIPRPPDVPAHWVPMHGDLTPWNMRRRSTGEIVIFDWEEAGWGPPGADEVLYHATYGALFGKAPDGRRESEAVGFWRKRIARNSAQSRSEARLQRDVNLVLEKMALECASRGPSKARPRFMPSDSKS